MSEQAPGGAPPAAPSTSSDSSPASSTSTSSPAAPADLQVLELLRRARAGDAAARDQVLDQLGYLPVGKRVAADAPAPSSTTSPATSSAASTWATRPLRMGRVVHFLQERDGRCSLAHVAGVVDAAHEIAELAVWRRGIWDSVQGAPHDLVDGGWHWPADCPRDE